MRASIVILGPVLVGAAFLAACDTASMPPAGDIGDACDAEAPCADGLACVSDPSFPGGYCSSVCSDGTCAAMSDCDETRTPPLCLARCAAATDCRDGYQCWEGNCRPLCTTDAECGDSTCVGGRCQGCTSNTDCAPDEQCALGICVAFDGGTNRPEGAPCSVDVDCASGLCLPPEAGGVCSIACGEASGCVLVSFEAACSPVVSGGVMRTACAPFSPSALSLGRACATDADCRSHACEGGQCGGVCADESDCLNGQICTSVPRAGLSYMGCGYASTLAVEEIDLGEMLINVSTVNELERALPPDAVSLTLQARAISGDPLELTFVRVIDPREQTLFDLSQIGMLVDTPERWLPLDTTESITMLVPNTSPDRIAFTGGLYRWSLSAFPRFEGDTGSARVRVSAIVKRGALTGGFLDVNVFLVDVGITAATAAGSTRLQAALSRVSAILDAEASVRLGSVSYFDVVGTDATRYSIIDSSDGPASELAGLFRLGAPRSGRALNIFLVREITGPDDESFTALGIAGGIPGPVGIHGTMHGGVVAAFDSTLISGSVAGHVLAHEIGHYLGLFHSSEQLRPCGPGEIPATAGCSPFGAGDTLADTARGDTTNLMFWSIVGAGSNVSLSAGQAHVVRASALVAP